jgi:hypothetical protein
MHPFWSSHKEKRTCVKLSMGGGHGRSWSSMGRLWGARRRGEGKGERGEERGRGLGRHGEREGCRRGTGPAASLLLLLACSLYVRN